MFIPIKDYNPTQRTCYITIILIILNIFIFLYQSFFTPVPSLNQKNFTPLNYHIVSNGMIPKEITSFTKINFKIPAPVINNSGAIIGYQDYLLKRKINPFLSIIYSIFMHGSILHLLGNILFLWIFGNNIEDQLGPWIFLLFYLICGIGASLIHLVFNWNSLVPVIGASGAVSGIMGAYLILYPKAQIKTLVFILFFITFIDIPAAVFLLIWFILQIINIGSASNIAWFAHIGGFLLGALLVYKITKRSKSKMEIIQ